MDYEEIFARFDDQDHWEWPPGFDYEKAVNRFERFAAALESRFGAPLHRETRSHIQDASFHSEINIGSSWIRFSSFGNMVAISNEELLTPEHLTMITSMLPDFGYLFIPENELSRRYVSRNPEVTWIPSWWERYFDYL